MLLPDSVASDHQSEYPTVGIVLAHRSGHGDLGASLRHITATANARTTIVVATDNPQLVGDVATIVHPGALVPELWAAGIRFLTTDRVALCSSAVAVASDWVATIERGGLDWTAAGGTIADSLLSGTVDRAVHRVRFNRHGLSEVDRPFLHSDLAADNAWYDRVAIGEVAASFSDGFWEPFVHTQLLQHSGRLMRDPGLRAEMLPGVSLRVALRQRVEHGRRHGQRWSQGRSRRTIALAVLSTPAIALVMTWRSNRAGKRDKQSLGLHAVVLLLFTAWAGGEFLGRIDALVTSSRRSRRSRQR